MQFVHGGAAKRFRIAQTDELRTAQVQSIETGNVCPALPRRKWIIHAVIVEEVVGREIAPAGADGIQAQTGLIVANSFIFRARESRAGCGLQIWQRYILQEKTGRSRPGALWDNRIGKHTRIRATRTAAWKEIRLALGDRISQSLRELAGKTRHSCTCTHN